ncbi:MAG: glucosaminidase [Desulfobulbaceae bacterium]|nr:glucosaminidase [Desulfobulbaceae bacterium]
MNNSSNTNLDTSANLDLPETYRAGWYTITPAKLLLLLISLGGVLGLGLLPYTSFRSGHAVVEAPAQTAVNVASGDELIVLLKEKGLWEITGHFAVPRLILASYPANIGSLDTEAKKKAFFNSLLPAALVAMAEVEKEKESIHTILTKIPGGYQDLVLSASLDTWAGTLTKQEIDTLLCLAFKYRTDRAEELIKRVDVIPLSLLMSQAALESSWGSSRIAREGNNLFGVLTWGDDAIALPANGDGNGHRYADYGSILESVQAYIVMLNRLPSYEHFRELRSRSHNPLKLAEGLQNYSERRRAYIVDIKEVIVGNDLSRYDECFLALPPPPAPKKAGFLNAVARQFHLDNPTSFNLL